MIRRGMVSRAGGSNTSIRGLVVEYVVAIDVTRVRFPADADVSMWRFIRASSECFAVLEFEALLV